MMLSVICIRVLRQATFTCKTWLSLACDCKPQLEIMLHFLHALLFNFQWHWHMSTIFTIVNNFVHFRTHCFSLYPSHISLRIYLACSLTSGISAASQCDIPHSNRSCELGVIALQKQLETSGRLRYSSGSEFESHAHCS